MAIKAYNMMAEINKEIERLKKINVIDLPFDYISIDSYKYDVIKYAEKTFIFIE